MRILYVGNCGGPENFERFYLFPQRIVNGLIRNGHLVQIFNDKDIARLSNPFRSSRLGIKKTNALLLKNCHDFLPEFIILAHCHFISNDTLSQIRQICPHVKIVHLNVDPLSDLGNCSRIKKRVDHVDGIFITTAGAALKDFSSAKTFSAFVPNPVDFAIDTGRAFENSKYSADLFFAARSMKESDHRQALVSNILNHTSGLKIDIYGAGENDRKLFGMKYMKTLASVKMGLVINKTEDYYLYASDRMSQYMGNGLLVFANAGPRYTDIFNTDELVTYQTENELIEKINYYHTHDSKCRMIAKNGHQKIHQIFSSDLVTQYMIEMTFGDIQGTYAWPTQKFIAGKDGQT